MHEVLSLVDLADGDEGGVFGFITDSNTSAGCGSALSNTC